MMGCATPTVSSRVGYTAATPVSAVGFRGEATGRVRTGAVRPGSAGVQMGVVSMPMAPADPETDCADATGESPTTRPAVATRVAIERVRRDIVLLRHADTTLDPMSHDSNTCHFGHRTSTGVAGSIPGSIPLHSRPPPLARAGRRTSGRGARK